MKKSEITAMNKSFRILEERRAKILDDDRTIRLKEHVKEIREHSIKNIDQLLYKAIKKLQKMI
jgi:L-lactate utilization protein LutB